MARKGKKPTVAQLTERVEVLEISVAELQQFVNLIGLSAKNDILRHEKILKELCDNAGVDFIEHEEPKANQEEKVEESQGGLTNMANVLLLCDELPLVWEWLKANPDANAWCYGSGLPRQVEGLEGRILPASLTLKEAKAFGEFDEIVTLPLPAKKTSKKGAGKDE